MQRHAPGDDEPAVEAQCAGAPPRLDHAEPHQRNDRNHAQSLKSPQRQQIPRGTTSGLSTGAGANPVSDVTHRIMAWATTTSHTTPMDAHIVTAPLRTGVVPRHPTHGNRS